MREILPALVVIGFILFSYLVIDIWVDIGNRGKGHVTKFDKVRINRDYRMPNGQSFEIDWPRDAYSFKAVILETDRKITQDLIDYINKLEYVSVRKLAPYNNPVGSFVLLLEIPPGRASNSYRKLLLDLWIYCLPEGVVHFPTEYGTTVYVSDTPLATIYTCENITERNKLEIQRLWLDRWEKENILNLAPIEQLPIEVEFEEQ